MEQCTIPISFIHFAIHFVFVMRFSINDEIIQRLTFQTVLFALEINHQLTIEVLDVACVFIFNYPESTYDKECKQIPE